MITQLLLLKWLSLWFFWRMNPRPDTWPGAALLSRDAAVTGDRWEELSEVDQHVTLGHLSRNSLLLSQNRETAARRSCVLQATSVVQALEVGVFQDAVDVQVGRQAHWRGQFWGVPRADGAAGAHGAVAGAVPRRCLVWSADAALAVGRLKKYRLRLAL